MPQHDDRPLPDAARACPKCGSHAKQLGEFRAAGGFLSSFFDYSNRRFKSVSCRQCGYTEFYNASISGTAKFLDFLAGN
ncbi:MAG TPA: zinc ribbon domain-containing protein [Roseateles sp.]